MNFLQDLLCEYWCGSGLHSLEGPRCQRSGWRGQKTLKSTDLAQKDPGPCVKGSWEDNFCLTFTVFPGFSPLASPSPRSAPSACQGTAAMPPPVHDAPHWGVTPRRDINFCCVKPLGELSSKTEGSFPLGAGTSEEHSVCRGLWAPQGSSSSPPGAWTQKVLGHIFSDIWKAQAWCGCGMGDQSEHGFWYGSWPWDPCLFSTSRWEAVLFKKKKDKQSFSTCTVSCGFILA